MGTHEDGEEIRSQDRAGKEGRREGGGAVHNKRILSALFPEKGEASWV